MPTKPTSPYHPAIPDWARLLQSPPIMISPSSQTLTHVNKYNILTKRMPREPILTPLSRWSDLKPGWNIHENNTCVCIYLCDGDGLSGFGWWSVGIGQTLSEQHRDLLQLLLSLLHIRILLQNLLQVRAARQVVLTEHNFMNATEMCNWHFKQSLNNIGGCEKLNYMPLLHINIFLQPWF